MVLEVPQAAWAGATGVTRDSSWRSGGSLVRIVDGRALGSVEAGAGSFPAGRSFARGGWTAGATVPDSRRDWATACAGAPTTRTGGVAVGLFCARRLPSVFGSAGRPG
jgi:hypothetical protein